jgi:ferric-dicitrate binding protein FerR (iron transport regulator)
MSTSEEYNLITKVITGEASNADRKTFDEKMESDDDFKTRYLESQKIWDATPVILEEADANEAWLRFAQKLKKSEPSKRNKSSYRAFLRIAAALLLFGVIGLIANRLYLYNPDVIIYTAANERKDISLPDGSKIILNSSSSVKYKKKFNNETRDIFLQGEAFFDVAKNPERPFIITTADSRTEVLGTSFNLKENTKSGSVVLTVSTGKVKFTSTKTGEFKVLTAGEAAIVSDGEVSETELDLNSIAWVSKKMVFRDAPMKQVISTIQDYFKVEINVSDTNINNCHFTAEFDSPKLTDVLDVLSRSLQLTYTIKGKQVNLSGKGCN